MYFYDPQKTENMLVVYRAPDGAAATRSIKRSLASYLGWVLLIGFALRIDSWNDGIKQWWLPP